ncbi:Serine/threonine-protein kinase PLK4 [Apiospora arundinis]
MCFAGVTPIWKSSPLVWVLRGGSGQMRGPLNTAGFMPDDTPRPQLPPRPTKEELEQVSQEIGIMLKTAPV